MADKPTPEPLPEEVLKALGIKQADVFIVKHGDDGRLTVITGNARKLHYTPGMEPLAPPAPQAATPEPTKPDAQGILTTLTQRSHARATRKRKKK